MRIWSAFNFALVIVRYYKNNYRVLLIPCGLFWVPHMWKISGSYSEEEIQEWSEIQKTKQIRLFMIEKRRARRNMIVLKYGKISKAVVSRKILLSPLGIGKEANFRKGGFGWLIRKNFVITWLTRPWSELLGAAREFLPVKVLGTHLSGIVWV